MFSTDIVKMRPSTGAFASLIVHILLFSTVSIRKASATVICSYYSAGSFFNISCSDSCCSGSFNTADQACCSTSYWNTSIYIGLSVPIFCCLISLLGGISYCCMVVKPSARSNQVSHLRSDSVFISNVPVKDDPPAYNELFKNFQAKSTGKHKVSGAVREEINSIDRSLTAANEIEPSAKKITHASTDSRTESPLPPPYRSENFHIV